MNTATTTKRTAADVVVGNVIRYGWGQKMTVTSITERFLKNGSKVICFTGDVPAHVIKGSKLRGMKCAAEMGAYVEYKATTQL